MLNNKAIYYDIDIPPPNESFEWIKINEILKENDTTNSETLVVFLDFLILRMVGLF